MQISKLVKENMLMEEIKKITPYVILVVMIIIQYYFAYCNQVPVMMSKI